MYLVQKWAGPMALCGSKEPNLPQDTVGLKGTLFTSWHQRTEDKTTVDLQRDQTLSGMTRLSRGCPDTKLQATSALYECLTKLLSYSSLLAKQSLPRAL